MYVPPLERKSRKAAGAETDLLGEVNVAGFRKAAMPSHRRPTRSSQARASVSAQTIPASIGNRGLAPRRCATIRLASRRIRFRRTLSRFLPEAMAARTCDGPPVGKRKRVRLITGRRDAEVDTPEKIREGRDRVQGDASKLGELNRLFNTASSTLNRLVCGRTDAQHVNERRQKCHARTMGIPNTRISRS
jgi:hypothetical protein